MEQSQEDKVCSGDVKTPLSDIGSNFWVVLCGARTWIPWSLWVLPNYEHSMILWFSVSLGPITRIISIQNAQNALSLLISLSLNDSLQAETAIWQTKSKMLHTGKTFAVSEDLSLDSKIEKLHWEPYTPLLYAVRIQMKRKKLKNVLLLQRKNFQS